MGIVEKCLSGFKKYTSKGLAYLCAFILVFMTAIVLWEILAGWFKIEANWVNELVKVSLIWIGFAGAAYALLQREHMALTLFRDKAKGNAKKVVMTIIDVLVLFVVIVLTVGGFAWVTQTIAGQTSAVLDVPLITYYFIVPASLLIMILASIVSIVEDVTGKKF